MNNNGEQMDETADQMMQAGQKVGKSASRKVGKAVRKASKKAGKAIAKTAIKAGAKIGAMVVKGLIAFIAAFWPLILFALVFIGLFLFITDITLESRPKNQELQAEEVTEMNKYGDELDEEGYYKLESLSDGNKLIKAFYSYFSDRSYYVMVGDDEKVYRPDSKYIKEKKVKDSYNREELFSLSPTALFTLDEYLNQGDVRTPEQFIQPVPHVYDKKKKEISLKKIVDKEGNLNIQSTQYGKDGKKTGKKTKGIWDYGFAPILHYKDFEVKAEERGTITQIEKWDKKTQKKVNKTTTSEEAETRMNKLAGETRHMWMIDQLASSAGTIHNEIEQNWEDSGEYRTWTETYKKKVDILYYKKVQDTNKDGKLLYYIAKPDEKNGGYIKTKKYSTTKSVFPKMKQVKDYKKEERTFTKTIEGTKWEDIPKYVGEPDLKKLTGSEYYREYFENYNIYVPKDVMTSFDIAKRLDKSSEELNKLLEEGSASATGGASVDVSGLNLGKDSDAGAYKKALESIDIFKKYGEMYGIDPYLLVALVSRESGGSHYNSDGSVRIGAAIGIMQIERLGSSRAVTAYNQETRANETFNASTDQFSNIDTNIKWGTMYLSTQIANSGYDVLSGLQAYNYGSFKAPWTQERAHAQRNGNAGDPLYIPHVLGYYASPDSKVPWVKNKEGQVMSADGSQVELGSVDSVNSTTLGSNSNGQVWGSFYNNVKAQWGKFAGTMENAFGLSEKDVDAPIYNNVSKNEVMERIHHPQDEDTAWMTTKLMIAFEEGQRLSNYDDFTEEDFKERFGLMFSNPFGKSLFKPEAKPAIDTKSFFPDGFESPVDNPKITTKYGFVKEEGEKDKDKEEVYHPGVDIAVTNGQAIKSVAAGTVFSIDKNGEKHIMIKHDNGVITIFKGLKDIKVKEGDKIKKGQKIATGGGSPHKKGTFHFEMKQYGKTQDPTWIVKPEEAGGAGGPVILDPNAKGFFQTPFPGSKFVYTSPYSMRVHPITGEVKKHQGSDLVSVKGEGASLHAVGAGTVVATATNPGGWGTYVVIDHGTIPELGGKHISTLYGHMVANSYTVKVGQKVEKGQQIGKMGNTGGSTGAHVHLEFLTGNPWSQLVNGLRQAEDAGKYIELPALGATSK